MGAQAVSSALAFAAMWLATRLLGAVGYGGVVAILAASQFIGQMGVQWTATAVTRYGCEEFVKTGRVSSAFWTRLLILVPNLLTVLALSPLWLPPIAAWLRVPPASHALILTHFVITAFWIHVQQTLQAVKLPRVQGWLLSLERGQIVLVLLGLMFAGKVSPLTVIGAYIIAPSLTSLAGLCWLRGLVRCEVHLDRSLVGQMVRFSLPLIPYSVVGYLFTNYLDAFFIMSYLSKAHLGVYSVAYQLTGTLMQLPVLAGSLLLPLFVTLRVNGRDRAVPSFFRQVLPLLILAWSTACVLIAALGGYLMPFIFGDSFREASPLLWPLMAASALAGAWLMGYAPISNAQSASYVTTAVGVAAALTNVALNFFLIPRWGLVGCAWATAAAYGAMSLVGACLVHCRVACHPVGTLTATLPALLSGLYATWRGDVGGALVIALLVAAGIAVLRRRSLIAGARLLVTRCRLDTTVPVPATRGA